MYVCTCICMYVCLYVCMYIRMYQWVQLHFVITVVPEGKIHVSKHFFRHHFKYFMTLRVYNYIVMLQIATTYHPHI